MSACGVLTYGYNRLRWPTNSGNSEHTLSPLQLFGMVESPLKTGKISYSTEHCHRGGGTLKIIAAIEDPFVFARIIGHSGLPTRVPPRSFDLLVTA